jgi:hypothetical protein
MEPISRPTLLMMLAFLVIGCGGNKTKTTDTDSAKFATLGEKKEFLERHVKFRRTYEELDFDITYTDGGDGWLPSPTEWDIRIAAKVPADEIDDWIAGLGAAQDVDAKWVSGIPKAPTRLDDFEWVTDGDRLVGFDRKQRVVAYRNRSL